MATTMMRPLVCIICIVLIRINEGTSSHDGDCMVTIEGPTKQITERPEDVDYLVVNKKEPAEFYCEFIRHDSDETKYRYRVYIDMINPFIPPDREVTFLTREEPHTPMGNTFNITNTNVNSTDSMTIYKTQIIFLSVDVDTPTLLVKCAIEYFPNGDMDSTNKTNCSSSSTFAIIPNNTCPIATQITTTGPIASPTINSSVTTGPIASPTNPTVTTGPIIIIASPTNPTVTTGTTAMSSTFISIDTSPIISESEFGSTVGVLCAIVMVETALILIFIVYQFAKYKKPQESKIDKVQISNSDRTQDAEINSNTIITAPDVIKNDRAMQALEFIPPNSADM